ncbi:MAG: hypothetical protein COB59_00810 [Rhodospirillaceae bacterium]|nr:MAG: hypothetical protein COB59_00810 [Rhodospirillaceae bacterium]
MNTKDAITKRRAVKAFDPDHRLTEVEEKELFSLALLAPTAFNIQNWRFVALKDPELRKQVRAASWDQAQVTDSSLLIVITADLKAWEKDTGRYWTNGSDDLKGFMLPAIDAYYRDKDQVQRDEAFRSSGIAAQTLMLAAQELGYDSCPMVGFDFDEVAKLIKLPDDHVIAMFVAVGKAAQDAYPRGGQLDQAEVVINNTF